MRHVREDFVPLISAVPGFMGYHFTDAGGGTALSTSIFETKANAEESNRVAAEWVKKNPKVLPAADSGDDRRSDWAQGEGLRTGG